MKKLSIGALSVGLGVIVIAGAEIETAAEVDQAQRLTDSSRNLRRSTTEADAATADEIKEGSDASKRLTNLKAGLRLGRAIPRVPVRDGFGRRELPLANGKWTRTSWTEEIGSSWCAPWHGYGANLSHRAGAYWNGATFSDSSGPVVAAATLGTGPIREVWSNEYLSLWLDMPNPGRVRSGYELRFEGANRTFDAYEVELSKWVSGHREVLAKAKGVSLPINTKFALSEAWGSLVAWTGTRTLTPVLSATDSTYRRGYAGIEANRGEGTAYNFRAGNVVDGRHKIPSKTRQGPPPHIGHKTPSCAHVSSPVPSPMALTASETTPPVDYPPS